MTILFLFLIYHAPKRYCESYICGRVWRWIPKEDYNQICDPPKGTTSIRPFKCESSTLRNSLPWHWADIFTHLSCENNIMNSPEVMPWKLHYIMIHQHAIYYSSGWFALCQAQLRSTWQWRRKKFNRPKWKNYRHFSEASHPIYRSHSLSVSRRSGECMTSPTSICAGKLVRTEWNSTILRVHCLNQTTI